MPDRPGWGSPPGLGNALDGGFVPTKESPGDFDACWETAGVVSRLLDPVLLDFTRRRAAQTTRFGGAFFIAEGAAE